MQLAVANGPLDVCCAMVLPFAVIWQVMVPPPASFVAVSETVLPRPSIVTLLFHGRRSLTVWRLNRDRVVLGD
jgi:hypothetical protein